MKHFMLPRNATIQNETIISPNPKQRNATPTANRKNKASKENAPPPDPNSIASPASVTATKKSPLPPRPPLKRKLSVESAATGSDTPSGSDSGVQVIVRMRPPSKDEEESMVAQKISKDSLSIGGHTFTFDSVADVESTQLDIFQLVGAPLVENCLAGFNSSVFAYGQTGSGKTYTIWGPTNALLGQDLSSDQQGLTPRVFQRLFERINEEQVKHVDKQLVYMCRCSFLEIYNEQITDLLDPSQKNLQIREDIKTGVYVENLTEECVSTMKDVSQLLIKGLSNRRIGATSMNAESSRSHSVFTCVVESRCKSTDGLSHLRTSRINLVDLAGSERQKLTGAAGDRLKEAGNINRSLSQLGNLINILAEVSQTGKQRHIPYRDSKLTFLLQESLGGNARLAMICAISPSQSCKSETYSTLRFAQRAKAVKNKAVVNEEMVDDVNVLREVIRQLRDELNRMKANGNQEGQSATHLVGWNARRSLNLLKFSLSRPMTLPHVDDDSDEEMEIVDEAEQSHEENNPTVQPQLAPSSSSMPFEEKEQGSEEMDVNMEDVEEVKNLIQSGGTDNCPISSRQSTETEDLSTKPRKRPSDDNAEEKTHANTSKSSQDYSASALSIVPCDTSPVLRSPTPTVSPRISSSRKSLRTSAMLTASSKSATQSKLDDKCVSITKPSSSISLRKSRSCFASTEHLAATLNRGLEIIENHRQSTALRRSTFRFSCKPADIKAVIPVIKIDAGVQTTFQQDESEKELLPSVCSKCKLRNSQPELVDVNHEQNMQLVPVEGSQSGAALKKQVPKAVEKVLAGAIRREMALEEMCAKKASEIMQLNRLVQQYKHERECNAIISQTRDDKIARLESLMDGILPTEEFMEEELLSLTHEHRILQEKYENHPEILRTKIELQRVQEELERYQNFFDLGERDVLLEEIQDLRTQLQFYIDSSAKSLKMRSPILQLTYSCEPNVRPPLSTVPESTEESVQQIFEQERIQWAETESKWISLVEELRSELEASRSLAQKQKQELEMEKKCSEELKEAMQMAMEGHARMLEQYADLEEKHMQLLARHRKIQDGIEDVKKAAAKAGVRGAESRFINALAAEISALKVEREKERRYFRDENKGLQAQLRDTAEAVQAAGELLVRLKEAEEAVAAAEKRAAAAEEQVEMAYKEIDKLKQLNMDHHTPVESSSPIYDTPRAKFDNLEIPSISADQQWREEFAPCYNIEEDPPSWFSGYDRCNI